MDPAVDDDAPEIPAPHQANRPEIGHEVNPARGA
jgi:hypothetical protein